MLRRNTKIRLSLMRLPNVKETDSLLVSRYHSCAVPVRGWCTDGPRGWHADGTRMVHIRYPDATLLVRGWYVFGTRMVCGSRFFLTTEGPMRFILTRTSRHFLGILPWTKCLRGLGARTLVETMRRTSLTELFLDAWCLYV